VNYIFILILLLNDITATIYITAYVLTEAQTLAIGGGGAF
jgi:hypothetical protein